MSKMHRRVALALLVPSALAAAALSGCGPTVPDTMKIGVLVPMSGPQALRGKDLLNGAQLAVDQINASTYKIAGKRVKLEIVSVDDKSELETAKKGAQSLIDSGVHVIIGSLTTPETAAIIPITSAKNVPQMFTATTASLHGLGNGNTFRLLANDTLQGRAMGVFTHQTLRSQRVATVVEAADYGRGLAQPFTAALKEAGREVVASVEVDTKGEVTADMARRLKAAQPDLIVVLAREPQLRSLFKALSEVDFTDVAVLGTNAVRNKNVASMQLPVRALYAAASAIDAGEFPAGRHFLTAFSGKFQLEPVWGAHYAYDAVYSIADAARRAGTLSGPELITKLKAIEPQAPVNQQMRWDSSGEQQYAGIAVYKAERGHWLPLVRSNAW
jgi:branched-chain amino acid transport system substrate-binding protein